MQLYGASCGYKIIKQKTMKQKILELLKEHREINSTDFTNLIPESKGEYTIYMPVREGINPNIVWMYGVTKQFIKDLNELMIDEKLIDWKSVDVMIFVFDGSPIYTMKICDKKCLHHQNECWLPVVITLKK